MNNLLIEIFALLSHTTFIQVSDPAEKVLKSFIVQSTLVLMKSKHGNCCNELTTESVNWRCMGTNKLKLCPYQRDRLENILKINLTSADSNISS